MYVGLFVLVQFTCLLYISVWICKRYLQDFLATVSFVACLVLDHIFLSYDLFSTKKSLKSCITQKTKQNKTNKTTQKTNKQKTCVHVLQPMFFITPQKATLLMSILAVSNYYAKDKS